MNEIVTKATRHQNHKKVVDSDEGRRRRQKATVSIRKAKKNDRLEKRRHASNENHLENTSGINVLDFVNCINNPSSSKEDIFEAVFNIRKTLSTSKTPPVKEVIESGSLIPLVDLLVRTDAPEIQLEAAWALTNVASSDFTGSLVKTPRCIEYLIKLVLSVNADIRQQSIWCLANIAGDKMEYRKEILRHGAVKPMVINLEKPDNPFLLRTVVWAIANLCRGELKSDFSLISEAIQPLYNAIQKSDDEDTVLDALWALSYISDGNAESVEAIFQLGEEFVIYMKNIIVSDNHRMMPPALRILGNFTSGNAMQTQVVIDTGVLAVAPKVLAKSNKRLRKEMCWLLSNIAAGSKKQIESILVVPKLAVKMVEISIESDFDTRKEAVWALSNACTEGSDNHIHFLVNQNIIWAMISALDINDSKLIIVVLDAIQKILTVSERLHQGYASILDEYGGLDKIEQLQNHDDEVVYKKSMQIIDQFFNDDDYIEDENLIPDLIDGEFAFGMSSSIVKTLFKEGNNVSNNTQPFGHQKVMQINC